MNRIWIYESHLVKFVDGDTILVDIDQGMNHWARKQYIRLAGINAPEVSGPSKDAGLAAKQYLVNLLAAVDPIYLATIEYHEFEKYGRVLAVVYAAPPTQLNWADAQLSDLMPGSINQEMIDSGNAVSYLG